MQTTPTAMQRIDLKTWWAPLISGVLAWLAFVLVGETPLLRAAGMAVAVSGIAAALRHFGGALAVLGSLTLALSPAYWSQTGGMESLDVGTTGLVLVLAGGGALVVWRFSRALPLGIGVGLVAFALLFWLQLSPERSLRLTTILAAWLLFLMIDTLLLTNPRPDAQAAPALPRYYVSGLLLVLSIGVLNDPLFALMIPAATLTMLLSKQRLPWWCWAVVAGIAVIGFSSLIATYTPSAAWPYSAEQAHDLGIQVPIAIMDGWRYGPRWVNLILLIAGQFSVIGAALGVLGLARMARWYPPLGTTTMVIFAMYAFFGLVYFGRNSPILLLPLMMMQVIWMTYAVYTLGQWLHKTRMAAQGIDRWLAPAVFALLPLLMLWQIVVS